MASDKVFLIIVDDTCVYNHDGILMASLRPDTDTANALEALLRLVTAGATPRLCLGPQYKDRTLQKCLELFWERSGVRWLDSESFGTFVEERADELATGASKVMQVRLSTVYDPDEAEDPELYAALRALLPTTASASVTTRKRTRA